MTTGIGETLRTARRQYGRSLADAAAETRVRETYLAALEEEEFAALGGGVYVKGFLASYARFLGLDPEPLLDAYRSEFEQDDEIAARPRPLAPMAPQERRGGPAVIVVAAGVLLLALAGIGMLVSGDDDGDRVPDRGPAPVPEQEPDQPVSPTPGGVPTSSPTPSPETLVIDGVEVALSVTGVASWMRVQVDGVTVIEGEQASGFSRTFAGDDVVSLRIGDASAVTLTANGQDQGSLGQARQVVVVTCLAGETECDVEVVA